MKMTLAEIAKLTEGELEGDAGRVVTGAAGLAEAKENDIAFLGNPKYAEQVEQTKAACVLLPRAAKRTASAARNCVYVDDPQWAFARILRVLEKEIYPRIPPGIHPKAEVHPEAKIGRNASVGAFSVIERGAAVGEGTEIGPQCFVGFNARIGKGCKIYPQVTIRENCEVGDRGIVHSGTVIGSDGFGFSTDRKTGSHRKIPQIGKVVVENDVEIGSNVSIDRATIGATRLGAGTKIDNLVQIAHNVQIGRNCFIVSQAGVAGSTRIGNHVILAGQAGVIGHLTIGDGAVITAQTGVIADVEPKAVLFGSPARPHREAMKLQVLYGKLPEIYEAVKCLREKIKQPETEGTHAKR